MFYLFIRFMVSQPIFYVLMKMYYFRNIWLFIIFIWLIYNFDYMFCGHLFLLRQMDVWWMWLTITKKTFDREKYKVLWPKGINKIWKMVSILTLYNNRKEISRKQKLRNFQDKNLKVHHNQFQCVALLAIQFLQPNLHKNIKTRNSNGDAWSATWTINQ